MRNEITLMHCKVQFMRRKAQFMKILIFNSCRQAIHLSHFNEIILSQSINKINKSEKKNIIF